MPARAPAPRARARMRRAGARASAWSKARYGVDDAICTGDHSCIRLSGCPSLTVKPNPDPLRTDPVASVIESCVGCGLCGEVAHAAVLCPSFYRAELIAQPATAGNRALDALRAPRSSPGSRAARADAGGMTGRDAAGHAAHRRARRRGRRRAHQLDRRRRRGLGLAGAKHLDPRRGAAHRRHHLLRRDLPVPSARARRASGRCWR